jgi:hypothetical protein
MTTLAELERLHPGIPWREPVLVRAFSRATDLGQGGPTGGPGWSVLACRVCVARLGLKAWEVTEAVRAGAPLPEGTFASREDWARHFEAHEREAA